MSGASEKLRRLETRARARLGARMTAMGTDASRLATSSVRQHPYVHVAAGGLLGFVLGACAGPRRGAGDRRSRPVLGLASRAAWLWIVRKLGND